MPKKGSQSKKGRPESPWGGKKPTSVGFDEKTLADIEAKRKVLGLSRSDYVLQVVKGVCPANSPTEEEEDIGAVQRALSRNPTNKVRILKSIESLNDLSYPQMQEFLREMGRLLSAWGDTDASIVAKPQTLAQLITETIESKPQLQGFAQLVEDTQLSADRILQLAQGVKPTDSEICDLAQGLWKSPDENWNEDELLDLVVAEFGDREIPQWNETPSSMSEEGAKEGEKELSNGG